MWRDAHNLPPPIPHNWIPFAHHLPPLPIYTPSHAARRKTNTSCGVRAIAGDSFYRIFVRKSWAPLRVQPFISRTISTGHRQFSMELAQLNQKTQRNYVCKDCGQIGNKNYRSLAPRGVLYRIYIYIVIAPNHHANAAALCASLCGGGSAMRRCER